MKLTPKTKIRILRDGTESDNYNFSIVGTTLHWGIVVGKVDVDKFLVKFTDSDNKVRIKGFNVERIRL